MKKFLVIIIFIFVSILSCKTDEGVSSGDPKVSGGYEKIDVNSGKVKMLKSFLQKEVEKKYSGIKIGEVKSAKAQVVAGYNYMLECEYVYEKKNKILKAKINEDLKTNLKLLELDI